MTATPGRAPGALSSDPAACSSNRHQRLACEPLALHSMHIVQQQGHVCSRLCCRAMLGDTISPYVAIHLRLGGGHTQR
jgi:hypothetical protein